MSGFFSSFDTFSQMGADAPEPATDEGGGGGGGANPPAWTVIGSHGFSGSSVWTVAFDDVFGGDGVWNQAYNGDELDAADGLGELLDAASLGLMFATSATGDYTSSTDDGMLLVGYYPKDSQGDWTVARRENANGKSVLLRLRAGSAPQCLIATKTTTGGVYTISATETFDTDNVAAEATNYLMRVTEVADVEAGDGGLDVELYVGAWTTGENEETILAGLALVDTLNIRSAEARAYRDATTDNIGRGVMRVANGTGTASTIDAIAWGTF